MADIDDDDDDGLEPSIEPSEGPKPSPKPSSGVLAAIKRASDGLRDWQTTCDTIDELYGRDEALTSAAGGVFSDHWTDPEYDLFWSSMEVMKPAVYAKPPEPVVAPQFQDRRRLPNLAAEMLERTVKSAFARTAIDEAMIGARDDLIFHNRGQLWCTYETDSKGGGQRVCIEHLDRKDFLHGLARKWSEVPWVSRRAWMNRKELRKRFKAHSGDAYKDAKLSSGSGEDKENKGKAGVWEFWDKARSRVYWVAEGVSVILDEGEPHLKLRGFFPCPRPAYGTLRPRTLVPVPDYVRYSPHLSKINSLTRRIYDLLDMVRMKGLIPAGGEIGDAVEQAMKESSDTALLIPVPAGALFQNGGKFVEWLPIDQIAAAITGLVEARRELFADFDRLSGISDIMRGEVDANEKLGQSRLKGQYGSVRVREKIDELQRIARDVTEISAEIMAENFSKETFLEMSQMQIPAKAEVDKRVASIEKAAKQEMRNAGTMAEKVIESRQVDPAEVQQKLKEAQQQILQKFGAELQAEEQTVPIEDVMKLLRDDKARGFAFEIATDSTVLTDENAEKANRLEFLKVFTEASAGLTSMAAQGPEAAKVAGGVFKFVLQPFRTGRELNGLIDEFIDAAPEMAARAAGGGDGEALIAAQNKLADAEMAKAQAQIAKVQSDASRDAAETSRKLQEMQSKYATETEKLRQQANANLVKADEALAKVDLIRAQTMKALAEAGVIVDNQALDEFRSLKDIEFRQTDQTMKAAGMVADQDQRARDADRADRAQLSNGTPGAEPFESPVI